MKRQRRRTLIQAIAAVGQNAYLPGFFRGVIFQVIGVAAGSIGEKLYESKVYFLTSDLLAWTVVIVLVSVLFEKVFLRLMKAAFDRWEAR